jgi:hypothetical protein
MNKEPPRKLDLSERHMKAKSLLEAELAKEYHTDFPEMYFEENENMDRLFMRWHETFGQRFLQILEEDFKKNGDNNFLDLYEKADTDTGRARIIRMLKKQLY